MGAIGMALLVREEFAGSRGSSAFKGFEISQTSYQASYFECTACTRLCEIAELSENGDVVARWGGRCDLWEGTESGEDRST
jgi:hypothetical protein